MTDNRISPFDPQTWTDEERRYFEYIDEKLSSGEDIGISNGKPIHAVFLIERFIKKAKNRIRLFSGKLSQKSDSGIPIYSDPHIVTAALEFLSKKESNLTIILEEEIDVDPWEKLEAHPLIQKILEAKEEGEIRGRFELRRANQRALSFLDRFNTRTHFMILDEQAYRIETDLEEMKAYVNFGNPDNAESLSILFDEGIYTDSDPLIGINN